jgi:hypothetical protein
LFDEKHGEGTGARFVRLVVANEDLHAAVLRADRPAMPATSLREPYCT